MLTAVGHGEDGNQVSTSGVKIHRWCRNRDPRQGHPEKIG
jgi:hypothetical protein